MWASLPGWWPGTLPAFRPVDGCPQLTEGPSVSTVEAFEEVGDSLCVPQYNRDGEERVILFLKMAPGHAFRPELVKRVREAIRLGLSARHVPSLILETQGIPVRAQPRPGNLVPWPALELVPVSGSWGQQRHPPLPSPPLQDGFEPPDDTGVPG